MKRVLLSVVVALSTFVCALAQDSSARPVYVINGKVVENFDGSQLLGKTISGYHIKEGRHYITTLDAVKVAADSLVSKKAVLPEVESVYVCDDKVISEEEMMAIDPARIQSISVIKQKGNPLFDKYTRNGCGVIIITLKK